MADSSTPADVAARDDAHLRSLGIKPELKRSLGFLSNFAVAFSYISVSTGTSRTQAVGIRRRRAGVLLGVAARHPRPDLRGPEFRRACQPLPGRRLDLPVVEAAFEQDARLVHRLVLLLGGRPHRHAPSPSPSRWSLSTHLRRPGFKLGDPSPARAVTTCTSFLALVTLISTTVINAFGVRLLSIINNIGVGAEILGMLVFALILLFFANHQSPSILFDTRGTANQPNGDYLPLFLIAMFMALFVVYGFDTAGTFGEETLDASRQAPRGVLVGDLAVGHRRGDLPARRHPLVPGRRRAIATAQAFGFPIADDDQAAT